MKSKEIKLTLKPRSYHRVEVRLRAILKYSLHLDEETRNAAYLSAMIRAEIREP